MIESDKFTRLFQRNMRQLVISGLLTIRIGLLLLSFTQKVSSASSMNSLWPLAIMALTNAQQRICDSECQKGCDSACQSSIQSAYDGEAALWVNDVISDPFYQTPSDINISSTEPSSLLRWQNISSPQLSSYWTIPGGLSTSRFLYVSEDVKRNPIFATGWLLLPYSNLEPCQKLRTIQIPFFLSQTGYDVVAPDHAGQGSEIPGGFKYLAAYLHAAEMAYSLIAARQATNILSDKWLLYGHSEGDGTAWRTNERLALPDQHRLRAAGELVGTVSAAPALRPLQLVESIHAKAAGGPSGQPLSLYFFQTLANIYPEELLPSNYLGEMATQRLNVINRSCFDTAYAAISNLTVGEIFKNLSWLSHSVTQDWDRRYNGAGPHPLASPMLVIQGDGDLFVPSEWTVGEFNKTCSAFPNSDIQVNIYPKIPHGPVIEASRLEVSAWIADRFNGIPITKGCGVENVKPLTENFGTGNVQWNGVNILHLSVTSLDTAPFIGMSPQMLSPSKSALVNGQNSKAIIRGHALRHQLGPKRDCAVRPLQRTASEGDHLPDIHLSQGESAVFRQMHECCPVVHPPRDLDPAISTILYFAVLPNVTRSHEDVPPLRLCIGLVSLSFMRGMPFFVATLEWKKDSRASVPSQPSKISS
ncbi:hypothetical protein CcaCcLH18_11328 [Colletotrichum camelliae]|nr:hypothetical protein CcaCcLH18_11328 [Colletotrichum camelliae]